MKKGELFRVQHKGSDKSFKSDVFVFLAEDDSIVLCSKIQLQTGLAEDYVMSLHKYDWYFCEIGEDIKQFIQDRLTKSTTTEADTVLSANLN